MRQSKDRPEKILNLQAQLLGLSDSFLAVVKIARAPAGSAFDSTEAIKEQLPEFFRQFNAGLNKLHREAIHHLMYLEENADRLNNDFGHSIVTDSIRQFWTTVCNFSAWTAFSEERHYLKQYWNDSPRVKLTQANPSLILRALQELSAGDERLTVWTDATSFLSSGDILIFDPKTRHRQFLEVKGISENSGFVVGVAVSEDRLKEMHRDLAQKDGQSKTDKKMNRLNRQLRTMRQLHQVVTEDEGVHPFHNLPIHITDSPAKDVH